MTKNNLASVNKTDDGLFVEVIHRVTWSHPVNELKKELTLKLRIIHQKYVAILSMVPSKQTSLQTPHASNYLDWLRNRDYQNLVVDRLLQLDNANKALIDLNITNEKKLNLIEEELSRF